MKKTLFVLILSAVLVFSLTACANERPAQSQAPADETQIVEGSENLNDSATEETEIHRQDGERFEAVIILEGMEETVQYEHAVNETAGFEMDYEYESFVRHSDTDGERFISLWDDPDSPENYLEVTRSAEDAENVAAALREELSEKYDLYEETRELDSAGNCIYIGAFELKDTDLMADQLQAVYIIPASDGCIVATEHYAIEAAEGFGRRMSYMLNSLMSLER